MIGRASHAPTQILRLLVAVTVMSVMGCTGRRRPVQPEPADDWQAAHVPWLGAQSRPAAAVHFKDPIEARYHMRMHFDDLRIIEQALVAGRLAEGLSIAYLLTRENEDPGLARWAAQSRRVNAAAVVLTRARDVDEALRQLARVAAECAGCHADSDSAPPFPSPPALPPDRPTREARMARHAWAADRLWEGAVGNDDSRWRTGLAVLAEAPLPSAVLSDGSSSAAGLQAYARKQLEIPFATPIDDRASAYGDMLILCAHCHATRERNR